MPTQLFAPSDSGVEAEAQPVEGQGHTPLHLHRLGSVRPQADPYARRAEPAPSAPRPVEATEWPPPPSRPVAPMSGSWDGDQTAFVVDPAVVRSRRGMVQVDRTTWILGIAALGFTGLVTGGSVLLVLFVLSLG